MRNKTNRSDYIGAILIVLMSALVFGLIGCGIFIDIKILALCLMIVYAICNIKLISLIGTIRKHKFIRYLITFVSIEAIQIVPYLIILAVRELL